MQIRGCRHVNVNEIVCVSDFRFDADKNVYKQTIWSLFRLSAQQFAPPICSPSCLRNIYIYTCANFNVLRPAYTNDFQNYQALKTIKSFKFLIFETLKDLFFKMFLVENFIKM